MAKVSTKDWRNLPTEKWNVTTFHAYLIEQNKELFEAEYVPFGKGSIANRWSTEKGQLKMAQRKYGNAVIRKFIERCLETHRPNPKFPHINFGFMWAYKRDELPRAQQEIARENVRQTNIYESRAKSNVEEIDESFF